MANGWRACFRKLGRSPVKRVNVRLWPGKLTLGIMLLVHDKCNQGKCPSCWESIKETPIDASDLVLNMPYHRFRMRNVRLIAKNI